MRRRHPNDREVVENTKVLDSMMIFRRSVASLEHKVWDLLTPAETSRVKQIAQHVEVIIKERTPK